MCRCDIEGSGDCGLPGPPAELHTRWFPHMRLRAGAATICFWLPFLRELFLRTGIIDCSEPYVRALLAEGKTVAIFTGGAQESNYSTPGVYKLYLSPHKGFLRLALETGSDVMSCYTFGDESVWRQHSAFPRFVRIVTETIGVAVPPAWLHLLPNRVPLTTVVGLPVELSDLQPLVGEPATDANVEEAMRRYTVQLRRLFEANKALVPGGHADGELELL